MHFGCRSKKIDDDEVVASFSVYFTPSLLEQAHIFQYPLRQNKTLYEANDVRLFATEGLGSNSSPATSRPTRKDVINPNSRLTMRCTLDTFNLNCFTSDSVDENKYRTGDDKLNYSFSLQSKPFTSHSDYVIGYFHDGALHLTPVSSIQQFLPVLDSKRTSNDVVSRSGTAPIRVPQEHCSSQTVPTVSPLFASIRLQKELARQRSVMLNSDAETAIELKFYSLASIASQNIKKMLICSTKENTSRMTSIRTPDSQVENSFYPPQLSASGGICEGENAFPSIVRCFAASYTISEQIKDLFRRCQVLTIEILRQNICTANSSTLTDRVWESNILDSLRSNAVYIHGVWVCSFSDKFKGFSAALRELILLKFQQSADATVKRSQLNSLVNTSRLRYAIKDVLETIAVLKTSEADPENRCWRLRHVPEDSIQYQASLKAAEARFQGEITAQQESWNTRAPQILNHLLYINVGQSPPTLFLVNRFEMNPNMANTNKGITYNTPTLNSTSFHRHGTQTFTEQELSPIQQYIRVLFAEHGVINKLRAKELVLKARQSHYPSATNQMLSVALQSQVQSFTSSTWILKTLGEPSVDRHRPLILRVILELKIFETRAVLNQLNNIKKQCDESMSSESSQAHQHTIPAQIVQRVITEVAEFKSGERLWHLKVGNVMME